MKINLRKKENSNGKTSLFLEYYLGFTKDTKGKIKHNRKYEFLDIQIFTNPKNTEQRNHNKKLTDIAETVLKQRQVESLQDDFEINSDKKLKTNFVEYYQGFLDKRILKAEL